MTMGILGQLVWKGWSLLNISYAANVKTILNYFGHVRLYF